MTILITGATNGIGKATARLAIKNKMHLIMVCRNEKLMEQTVEDLRRIDRNAEIDCFTCDFSDLISVELAGKAIKERNFKIDFAYFNAGALPNKKNVDELHIRQAMIVNYIGPRLLLENIFDAVMMSEHQTIINTISMSSPKKLSQIKLDDLQSISKTGAYAVSKLAMSIYLSSLTDNNQVKIRLLDPKIVYSNTTINFLPKPIRFLHPLIKLVSRKPEVIANEVNEILLDNNPKQIITYRKGKMIKNNPLNFEQSLKKRVESYYHEILTLLSE